MAQVPKIPWNGVALSVQPRIRLTRSFDQRSHSYLGYVVRLQGTIGVDERIFSVAVGKAAHEKHGFRVGDSLSGQGVPVDDPRMETAELYKASQLKVGHPENAEPSNTPPWHGSPPDLSVYRQRGHRRLAARTFIKRCSTCIWGANMAVEMIIDQWNPGTRRYRKETFCYGPISCPSYAAGPTRKVPGRRGMSWMSWEEEDWVDEQDVSNRGPNE